MQPISYADLRFPPEVVGHAVWLYQHDGPPVEKPSRKGFGSSLIQRLLTAQCQGEITFTYDRSGLQFQMSVPLGRAELNEQSRLRAGEPSSPSRVEPAPRALSR